MKTTNGLAFKKFMQDPLVWPEDSYHEDEVFTIDGVKHEDGVVASKVKDDAVVVIDGGSICYLNGDTKNLEREFAKWQKKQDCTWITCECKKELADAVTNAIKAAGGKVL